MSVDDIGDHIPCFAPGGRLLVTMGMPGVTKTSQFSGTSPRVATSVILSFPSLAILRRSAPLYLGNTPTQKSRAIPEFDSFELASCKKSGCVAITNRHRR